VPAAPVNISEHLYWQNAIKFQLNPEEVARLRCQIGISKPGRGGRRYAPYAFTEQGVAMLSGVLRSPRAVQANMSRTVWGGGGRHGPGAPSRPEPPLPFTLRAGRFTAPGSTLLKTIPDAGRLTWDDIQKLYPVLRQLDQYVERLMSC